MKVVIVGGGPAGVSAALYVVRTGIEVTIVTERQSALAKTDWLENYYGFPGGIAGPELFERGLKSAEELGVSIVYSQVVSLGHDGSFKVTTSDGDVIEADGVVLATGSQRTAPRIKNLANLEGKGVGYCAVCDAFFYRGRPVAVYGGGEYALHEAKVLADVAESVTILTNGEEPSVEFPPEMNVVKDKIVELIGTDSLTGVLLENDRTVNFDGLFIAIGVAGSTGLARKIGAAIDGNSIDVNDKMRTSIPCLYAAGDCTGGFLQVAKAVYQGAVAGISLSGELKKR